MQTIQASTTALRPTATFRDDLLRAVPKLRIFAMSLCRDSQRSGDLVQETLVKALTHATDFEPGSNMTAWLSTILRNEFYSEYRKRRRETEDDGDRHANRLRVFPTQEGHVYLLDVRDALDRLTAEHREALTLSVSGLTYDEAAAVCGCAVGTMKSRTSRARDKLAHILDDGQPWVGGDSPYSGTCGTPTAPDGSYPFE
jgi:RNA polymerase sigma-70 factor (ECF subfamily)